MRPGHLLDCFLVLIPCSTAYRAYTCPNRSASLATMAHHHQCNHDHQVHHQHHHHHHVHSNETPDKTLGEKNKEHFDHVAATIFDTPWVAKLGEQVTQELRENFAWFGVRAGSAGSATKMLDYACGSGVVSRALASHVSVVRGIDISSAMVTQYNTLAEKAGFPPETMRAVHGDLLDGDATPSPELAETAAATAEFSGFDLAVMSLALHHVADVDAMVQRLADRLVDGGVLVIVDWMSEEASVEGWKKFVDADRDEDLPARQTVSRMGFSERPLRETFEKAGLKKGWGWRAFVEESEVPSTVGGRLRGFMAKGVKGA
ncbi:hypothetical protein JDV02_004827 [Purpureocillium takamizusanense]|uniref:Methyltransferase type 12 domain-containing protein n=1 Tax=Purpureocillium takamizusanense TaxID=2060973 RepID=A0A9Q8QG07_9HYPO|nr:uncharacterized protein JDV02_004827 [Purpureocillium takamizusanense]UNI18567.1 hypothetical protein JDV02_004827 [Purpureocillium takamizusanense]